MPGRRRLVCAVGTSSALPQRKPHLSPACSVGLPMRGPPLWSSLQLTHHHLYPQLLQRLLTSAPQLELASQSESQPCRPLQRMAHGVVFPLLS